MRTVRIITNITLDGVIQSPGGPDEDGDFASGGWAMRYFDSAMNEAIAAAQGTRFDLLLGRRTYDIFARYWPKVANDPIADGLNAARKYVATHRPDSLVWGPVENLGPDIVERVRGLRSQDGPALIVYGSTTLTSLLLRHGLADEVLLIVYPILLGTGKRFFSEHDAPRELALISTRTTASGVVLSTYRLVGPSQNAASADATT